MSLNGRPKTEALSIREMDDIQIQVMIYSGFMELSKRRSVDVTDLIWDCYTEVREELARQEDES